MEQMNLLLKKVRKLIFLSKSSLNKQKLNKKMYFIYKKTSKFPISFAFLKKKNNLI